MMDEEEESVTICVGDIHGYVHRLLRLWANLQRCLGASLFGRATLIFLGDYNDRGPHTSAVLEFLTALPRRYPLQKHVFLCGNHDLAFAAFLGCLPPAPPGFSYAATWDTLCDREEVEGWWNGEGVEDVHVQGRRWGGTMKTKYNAKKGIEYKGSTYDSATTFASYGVAHGDRLALIKAVPDNHKTFLQNLKWVYEDDNWNRVDAGVYHKKLIAVHAGLEKSRSLQDQVSELRRRDVTIPRLEALSGRQNVWETPSELVADQVLVVSGHHGSLYIDKYRIIIDEGGGLEHLPLAAIILPSGKVIRDTDCDVVEKNLSRK